MRGRNERVRVLYSFPNKLGADRICYTAWKQVKGLAAAGADRICYTAWKQVKGLAAAGADLLVFPGMLHRLVPAPHRLRQGPQFIARDLTEFIRVFGARRRS